MCSAFTPYIKESAIINLGLDTNGLVKKQFEEHNSDSHRDTPHSHRMWDPV